MIKIDCHQHFWSLQRNDYDWLTSDLEPLYRDFLPDELSGKLKKNGIEGTVLVQAAATVEETRYLLDLASQHPFVKGVVGWVDFESEDVLSTLTELAQNPLFKGVRPMIQEIKDDKWILSPNFEAVFDKLIELDLTFDALIKPQHIKIIDTLAKRFPDLKIVIDHCAKPELTRFKTNSNANQWFFDIASISINKNVYCKLSGVLTEAGESPDFLLIRNVMDHILKSFGARRVMWGSDWPVVNLASDYDNWFNVVKIFLEETIPNYQHLIWAGSAIEFYSLNVGEVE